MNIFAKTTIAVLCAAAATIVPSATASAENAQPRKATTIAPGMLLRTLATYSESDFSPRRGKVKDASHVVMGSGQATQVRRMATNRR